MDRARKRGICVNTDSAFNMFQCDRKSVRGVVYFTYKDVCKTRGDKNMSDTIKGAIIGALITTLGSVLIFFLGNFSTQATLEKNTVETLSEYFNSVDKDMSYKQALQTIYEDYKNIKDENSQLQEQLSTAQSQVSADKKNKEVIDTANSFGDLGDYEKALSILNEVEEKTPEMELLFTEYSGKYESQIIDNASNLQEEGKYDEAVEIIDNALKVLPNSNELISKKEKIIAEKPQNFMDVCEPYETSYNYKKFINGETFQMSGQQRTNGFTIMGYDNQALSNLDGKYKELCFDVGHVDGAEMLDATLSIYLDGVFYQSYDIKADALPINVRIPVEGKKQIKFFIKDGRSVAMYSTTIGFADMLIR